MKASCIDDNVTCMMSLLIVARNVCDMTFVSWSIILVDGIPPGVTVPNPRS